MPTGRRAVTWVALAVTVIATAAVTLPGTGAPAGRTMALLAVAFGAWVVVLVAAHRWGTLARRVVLAATAAGAAIAVIAPPVGSTDVASYAVYGRMVAAHHANPYSHVPADFPSDPWLTRMAPFWHHTSSVYGPVFTAVSAAGMKLTGTSVLRGRLFFQLLELAAFLVALWLVDRWTRGDTAALAFFGLNPVIVASVVNGGHNDLLVGVLVLAAVVVATATATAESPRAVRTGGEHAPPAVQIDRQFGQKKLVAAGLLLAAAVMVKLVAVLGAAALVLWLWRHRGLVAAAWVGGAMVVTTAVGYLLAGGRTALDPVLHAGDRALLPSPWAYPRRWLAHRFVTDGVAGAADAASRDIGRAALVTVVLVAALVMVARMRDRTPVAAVGGAMLAFLVGGAYLMAWYPAWVLPVLALRWRSRLSLVAAAYAGLLLLAHVELPSQLHGVTLTVERLLHDTLVPLAAIAVIVWLLGDSGWRLWRARDDRAGTATDGDTDTDARKNTEAGAVQPAGAPVS